MINLSESKNPPTEVAIITDTHFGARNDSRVFLDNQRRFCDEMFFPMLAERRIHHLLHLGDYFDRRKFINFSTLWESNQFFLEKLAEYDIHMYVVAGNHDTAYKNTNRVNSLDLSIASHPNVTVFSNDTQDIQLSNDLIVKMVPWINSENQSRIMRDIAFNENNASVLAGHFEIAGFTMHKGAAVSDHGMDTDVFTSYDKVLSGHYHHKSTSNGIMYLGAAFEFNWSDYDDPRGFHIMQTNSESSIEFIRNPYCVFHHIDYHHESSSPSQNFSLIENGFVKVLQHDNHDPYHFDRFLENVYSYAPHNVQVVDMRNDPDDPINGGMTDEEIQDRVKDTAQLIDECVDSIDDSEIDSDAERDQLRKLMIRLYQQSQQEEETDPDD